MNIVVCCKVVPDDQDIQVAADGTLDYSKAKPIVSAYDLNAIEAAAQLADGGRVVAVTAGRHRRLQAEEEHPRPRRRRAVHDGRRRVQGP